MKKIFLSLAVLAMTALTANAQMLIGGSLGLNVGGGSGSLNFDMEAMPTIGYAINDNWEVGAGIMLGGRLNKTKVSKSSMFKWSIDPYARYYFFNRDNWKIGVHGQANVGGELPVGVGSASMSVTWGLNFCPVVTYSPTEHWVLMASCGFLGFGLNGVEKSCTFGLNAMTGGASQIGLGFAYKF